MYLQESYVVEELERLWREPVGAERHHRRWRREWQHCQPKRPPTATARRFGRMINLVNRLRARAIVEPDAG